MNLTLISGTLQASASLTVTGTTTLNNSTVTLGGTGNTAAINFAGPVTLIGLNNSLTVFTGSTTVIGGVISDTTNTTVNSRAFTKAGTGTLILTGANTYNALTSLLGGTVVLQNSSALGASALVPSLNSTGNASSTMGEGATVVANNVLVQLVGGVAVSNPLVLSGGTLESVTGANQLNGNIFLTAAQTFQVDTGSLTITGTISGSADVTKTGGGTLSLLSAGYYTGQTNISGGIVSLGIMPVGGLGNTNAPGSGQNGLGIDTGMAVVASGATLQLATSAATTYAGKNLILSGTGFGLTQSGGILAGTGALQNAPLTTQGGGNNFTNTWTGAIVLNADTTISSTSPSGATGTLALTGVISSASGTTNLTKVGSGNVFLEAAETYTGALNVNAGTLTLNALGQLTATATVNVNPTATFTLDNTVTVTGTGGYWR